MTVSSNSYLTVTEMTPNAQYILNYFTAQGWSKNAICGMLGNMQKESTINPGVWQNLDEGNTSGGLGLVQWTPATIIINWCNASGLTYTDINAQCRRIMYELNQGLQWISTSEYPMSFADFTVSTQTPSYLASAFLKNYERAGVSAENERQQYAEYWYEHLTPGINFEPRFTAPTSDNLYYVKTTYGGYNKCILINSSNGLTMPNCTGYAYGRFMEECGKHSCKLSRGNGNRWWGHTSDGYDRGQTPKLGAVICFDGGSAGHVAIVEQINQDGTIVTSNSAYGGTFFYLHTLSPDNNYKDGVHNCQGFIYNPYLADEPIPPEPPTPTGDKEKNRFNFLLFDRRRRRRITNG